MAEPLDEDMEALNGLTLPLPLIEGTFLCLEGMGVSLCWEVYDELGPLSGFVLRVFDRVESIAVARGVLPEAV